MKKPDRRIYKTTHAIKRAFAELLCTKNANEITVKEIADKADVCRKTLYYHYDGVWAVMEDLEKDVSEMFEKAIEETYVQKDMKDPQFVFEIILSVVKTDPVLITNLFRSEKNYSFLYNISRLIVTRFGSTLKEFFSLKPPLNDIFSELYVAGLISAFRKWLTVSDSLPIEKLSDEIGKVVFSGLSVYKK